MGVHAYDYAAKSAACLPTVAGFQTAFVFMKVARLHAYDYAAFGRLIVPTAAFHRYVEQGVYPQDWAGIIEEGDFGE